MSGFGSGRFPRRFAGTIDFIDVSDVFNLITQALMTKGELDPSERHQLEVLVALRAAKAQVYGN